MTGKFLKYEISKQLWWCLNKQKKYLMIAGGWFILLFLLSANSRKSPTTKVSRKGINSLLFEHENRDLLRRSLFSWTLGFGLVRLYQHEFGLWHRKFHISFYVKIQHIRLEKQKTGLVCKFGLVGHCFLCWNIFI